MLSTAFSGVNYCCKNHNYMTRLRTKKLLDIASDKTDIANKYNCITDWRKFKKYFLYINQNELSYFKLKTLLNMSLFKH